MPISSYWQTTDRRTVKLYQGDALKVLRALPSESVHMIVTSPPYWGLRDYQTGTWEGGDAQCDHLEMTVGMSSSNTLGPDKHLPRTNATNIGRVQQFHEWCRKCGARRTDEQLGAESTPEEYVEKLVLIFREARRVLRKDGILFLNLGDTYSSGGGGNYGNGKNAQHGDGQVYTTNQVRDTTLPGGNLVGIPWRVAFALQADDWILRQEIIWAKPSPMPESVTNRCTKAHEQIFLLSKSHDYYFDAEAIKEESVYGYREWSAAKAGSKGVVEGHTHYKCGDMTRGHGGLSAGGDGSPRNKRSVWSIEDDKELYNWLASAAPEVLAEFLMRHECCDEERVLVSDGDMGKRSVWNVAHGGGYKGAHFATYPPKLIEPCILAGTSAVGCCPECGAPWIRVIEKRRVVTRPGKDSKVTTEAGRRDGMETGNRDPERHVTESRTIGWRPGCRCYRLQIIGEQPSQPQQGVRETEGAFQKRYDQWESGMQNWLEDWKALKPLYEEALGVDEGAFAAADHIRDYEGTVPCTVLDPFIGSGTTALVSLSLGRRCVGIDLSEEYLKNHCVERVKATLLSRPGMRHLVKR